LKPVSLCLDSIPSLFYIPPATTELVALSLHDALPISDEAVVLPALDPLINARIPCVSLDRRLHRPDVPYVTSDNQRGAAEAVLRSEEHTSELQSRENLVCRLLLEKKNKIDINKI